MEVRGRRFSYIHVPGPGVPVLMLHGFGGNAATWLYNIPALRRHGDIYALDIPGHGESFADVGDPSYEGLTVSVNDFVNAVFSSNFHIVAHSLGAAIAIGIALAHNEKVESLTLISCPGARPDFNRQFFLDYMRAETVDDFAECLRHVVSSPEADLDALARSTMKFLSAPEYAEANRRIIMANMSEEDIMKVPVGRIDEIEAPVKLVWGRDDRITPVEHAACFPDKVSVEYIDGVGHMPHLEAPGEVNEILLSVLKQACS